jgi:hypothetical protein
LKHINKISIIFLFVLSSCAPSGDRGGFSDRMSAFEKDKFFADPLVFYSIDSAKPRLDLSIEVPIENISFQKDYKNQIYDSKITITVNIKNQAGETTLSKSYIETSSYDYKEIKEKSKESQFYFYNFYITAGNYKVEVVLKDNNTNNEYTKSYDVAVKDFKSHDVTISDLMVLSKIDVASDGTKEITPLISNNIFSLKEMYAFFEIYNNTEKEITKEYVFRLKDNKDEIVNEAAMSYVLAPNKNQKFETLFLLKGLRKYIPVERQFEFDPDAQPKSIFFKLEIIDKSSNPAASQKKLFFFPDNPMHVMMRRQPPPGR